MTTFKEEKVRCSLCSTKTKYTGITSTNAFGSTDLDTRPPEMERSTIVAWVQRCPKCGYCASDVSTARPEAQTVVIGQEYKDQLNDPTYPKLAASFLCKAILDRESKDFAAATWALIHAAWVCDDSDQAEEAMACRQKAADMLVIAEEHRQQVAEQDGASTTMLIDLLRRSGQFEQARKTIVERRRMISERIIARILDFQTCLLDRNDTGCHTTAEALGENWTWETRAELSIQGKEDDTMGKVIKYTNKPKERREGSSSDSSMSVPVTSPLKAKQKERITDKDGTCSEADLNLHRQLLQKLMSDNEFPQAKIVAKHLTDLQPDDAYTWYLQGVVLLALCEPEHAEPCLLRSIEIAGADGWDCYNMSRSRLLMGDLEGAADWCGRAIKLDPDKPPFYWKLMEIHSVRGDLAAAIAVGKQSLPKMNEKSHEIRTRRTLADLYGSMSAFDESAEQLREALKIDDCNADLWRELGQCLRNQEKVEEALKAFQKAAEIEPHHPGILHDIGSAFIDLDQPEKAIEALHQAIRLRHEFGNTHYELSRAYLKLKNYQEAEKSAQVALRYDPDKECKRISLSIAAMENLGVALTKQGRFEEAEACFRQNLGLVKITYFNLGWLMFFRMKRYSDALENFQRALELDPDNPEYTNLVGDAYDEMGQMDEAEKYYRRAIEIDKNNANNHYDLGVFLSRRRGLKEDALASFERALEIGTMIGHTYYGIACTYALSQEEDLALEFLEKAFCHGFPEEGHDDHINSDQDWNDLRMNPKFIQLIEKYIK